VLQALGFLEKSVKYYAFIFAVFLALPFKATAFDIQILEIQVIEPSQNHVPTLLPHSTDGQKLLAWLGSIGDIERVEIFKPWINAGQIVFDFEYIMRRLEAASNIDLTKDRFSNPPLSNGLIIFQEGTILPFSMGLSGITVNDILFGSCCKT